MIKYHISRLELSNKKLANFYRYKRFSRNDRIFKTKYSTNSYSETNGADDHQMILVGFISGALRRMFLMNW